MPEGPIEAEIQRLTDEARELLDAADAEAAKIDNFVGQAAADHHLKGALARAVLALVHRLAPESVEVTTSDAADEAFADRVSEGVPSADAPAAPAGAEGPPADLANASTASGAPGAGDEPDGSGAPPSGTEGAAADAGEQSGSSS